MTNFFPAYMESAVDVGNGAECRYNNEHKIGMLYVNGYKKNPVHYTFQSEAEFIEIVKNNADKLKAFVRDCATMHTPKGMAKRAKIHNY